MYPCGVPPIISFRRVIRFPNQIYGSSSQNTLHHHSFTHTSLSIHANFGATRFINRALSHLVGLAQTSLASASEASLLEDPPTTM